MWKYLLVIALVAKGSFAGESQNCDFQKCENEEAVSAFAFPVPNEARLKEICTPVMNYLECQMSTILSCNNMSAEEILQSDSHYASFLRQMLDFENVFGDLCNETTTFHRDYVAHVDCFNRHIGSPTDHPKCRSQAAEITQAYVDSKGMPEISENITTFTNVRCLEGAYTMACASVELGEKCCEVARTTFVDVLRRVHYLTLEDCSKDDIDELSTTYLDFLSFDTQKKSMFEEVISTTQ